MRGAHDCTGGKYGTVSESVRECAFLGTGGLFIWKDLAGDEPKADRCDVWMSYFVTDSHAFEGRVCTKGSTVGCASMEVCPEHSLSRCAVLRLILL